MDSDQKWVLDALGPDWRFVGLGWHPWDLQRGSGETRVRIQVKQCALLQLWGATKQPAFQFSWSTRPPSYFERDNPGWTMELVNAGEDIGLATVYRVLGQFEAAGLVVKHNFESGQAYYELDSGEHHDHMVCVETGAVIEFVSEEIEALQKKIAADHGYEIEDHNLVIYVRPGKRRK